MANQKDIKDIIEKYGKYIANIEWHIKVNKPSGAELDQCEEQLASMKEIHTDLLSIQEAERAIELVNALEKIATHPEDAENKFPMLTIESFKQLAKTALTNYKKQ